MIIRKIKEKWEKFKELHLALKILFVIVGVVCIGAVFWELWTHSTSLKKPYMIKLDNKYKTPDGMAYNPIDGNIYLVIPAAEEEGEAPLLVITPDDKVKEVFSIPVNPDTNHAGVLGIAFGPDGNLYVADSQEISKHVNHNGRLLRIVFKDGKPDSCEVLATNFVAPNGLTVANGKVYFSETRVTEDMPTPLTSGLFCFDLNELDPANPYCAKTYVSETDHDPHFIFEFKTNNKSWPVGANGCSSSVDGKVYVANFGEKQIYELTLDADGSKVISSRDVISDQKGRKKLMSIDGIRVDSTHGCIYFADFVGNAVHKVDISTGKVTTLAKNRVGTGKNGALDRCSEVCRRGNKLYISNIDLTIDNVNVNDEPYSMSVIEL